MIIKIKTLVNSENFMRIVVQCIGPLGLFILYLLYQCLLAFGNREIIREKIDELLLR